MSRYLPAALVFALSLIASAAPAFGYSVKGVSLGDHVHFGSSDAYKKYACSNSQAFYGNEFAGFTWCTKTEHVKTEDESEKRGPFKAYYTILHSDDGTIVYVNRNQEPAYWGKDEVQSDINYYSRRIGARPTRIIPMPSRRGFSDGTIAIWGDVILERIVDPESLKLLAVEKNPKLGVLIDFIGDYARSAKNDLPVYRILGGPGFVWSASYNSNGRGTLRILAIDPSAFYPHTIAAPKIPPPPPPQQRPDGRDDTYAAIGWWSITHKLVDNMNGCDASSEFRDQTFFQMALVQFNPSEKQWLIFISNPNWKRWMSGKRQHTLRLVTTKSWQFDFGITDSNTLWIGNLSIDFMNSIADASSIEILNENDDLLASLDMTDSAAAIGAVVDCVRDHPYVVVATPRPEPRQTPTPEPETIVSGTAFFLAPNRLVTNHHVVKDCTGTIEVRYPDQPPSSAFVDSQDPANDLALLHTDLRSISVASFRVNPRLGEQIATYGFPYSGILSSSGSFTLGNVSSLSGIRDDTRFLQITAPIQPGNSGGPVLDMSGNVLGMVVSRLLIQGGESAPQNVNFAIQASIVTNFLSMKGISPKLTGSAERRELAPSDVADAAKAFTVRIYCKAVERVSNRSTDDPALSAFGFAPLPGSNTAPLRLRHHPRNEQ